MDSLRKTAWHGAIDGSTMLRWTACDGQLGNGWLGNGVMDGSQYVAAFLLQIFQE
jgi:hypothetical protein